MTIKDKLEEIEFIFLTLQQEESVVRGRKLIREVIEAKFGKGGEEDEHI